MTLHAANARAFLRDEKRAAWHDQTLWLVRKKRDAAARAVPEWEQLRQRASEIKDAVLENLDALADEFAAAAEKNGVIVLRARDAAEFNAHILEIIRRHGAKNVVKSKSMLTEECGMNHFLSDNGIEIVDTDLGERIIQLRKELPSHIVLPAIHIKKEEIGELFHEKLGSEKGLVDPVKLTRIARAHLREKFLAADVALTGVNFAVAETGTVVVCTNEGNADMGVHSAPVQVHCLGLEKLIPKWKDLGVFTRLLARNATGQPVTTYTSHYGAPKPGGAMYVVLVDNGRRARNGTARAASLKCIRCGGCMNTCPVYRRSGGHSYGYLIPGPIGTILAPCADRCHYSQLPISSTLCGSCANVCPVRIDIHEQIYALRQEATPPLWKKVAMCGGNFVFSHPAIYRAAGATARWGVRNLPRPFLYNPLNIWGKERELPTPPKKSFRQWYLENRGIGDKESRVKNDTARSYCASECFCGKNGTDSAVNIPAFLHGENLVKKFCENLEKAGGKVIFSNDTGAIPNLVDFTNPEIAARFSANCSRDALEKLETVLLPGQFGVAENGAIWLRDSDLSNRLVPFICRHLVLKMEAKNIVATMEEAYEKILQNDTARNFSKFGVFISGPSKTADIEQTLVYGAHGAIELTVIISGANDGQ